MFFIRLSVKRPTTVAVGWGIVGLAAVFAVGCLETPLDPVPEYTVERESRFALTPEAARLSYVVLGDWGRRGGSYQQDVAVQMGFTAQRLASRFVISTGDNFYERGVRSVTDTHWKASFERIYTHTALMTPWYITLGNHDHKGNVQAQIDYSRRSARWTLPAAYYSVVQEIDEETTVRFVFLDTEPIHKRDKDAPRQRRWLDSTLTASTAERNIVVGHHPVYSGGDHGDDEVLIQDLLPVLKKHQVDAYFSGHEHDLQHLHDGDLHYFVSGAASKVRPSGRHQYTQFEITRPGFMSVSMTPTEMAVRFIDHEGNTLYGMEVGVRVRARADMNERLEVITH